MFILFTGSSVYHDNLHFGSAAPGAVHPDDGPNGNAASYAVQRISPALV